MDSEACPQRTLEVKFLKTAAFHAITLVRTSKHKTPRFTNILLHLRAPGFVQNWRSSSFLQNCFKFASSAIQRLSCKHFKRICPWTSFKYWLFLAMFVSLELVVYLVSYVPSNALTPTSPSRGGLLQLRGGLLGEL